MRPRQLTWKLLLYSDLQQDLAFTDLDAVLQKQKPDIIELQAGMTSCLLMEQYECAPSQDLTLNRPDIGPLKPCLHVSVSAQSLRRFFSRFSACS